MFWYNGPTYLWCPISHYGFLKFYSLWNGGVRTSLYPPSLEVLDLSHSVHTSRCTILDVRSQSPVTGRYHCDSSVVLLIWSPRWKTRERLETTNKHNSFGWTYDLRSVGLLRRTYQLTTSWRPPLHTRPPLSICVGLVNGRTPLILRRFVLVTILCFNYSGAFLIFSFVIFIRKRIRRPWNRRIQNKGQNLSHSSSY